MRPRPSELGTAPRADPHLGPVVFLGLCKQSWEPVGPGPAQDKHFTSRILVLHKEPSSTAALHFLSAGVKGQGASGSERAHESAHRKKQHVRFQRQKPSENQQDWRELIICWPRKRSRPILTEKPEGTQHPPHGGATPGLQPPPAGRGGGANLTRRHQSLLLLIGLHHLYSICVWTGFGSVPRDQHREQSYSTSSRGLWEIQRK